MGLVYVWETFISTRKVSHSFEHQLTVSHIYTKEYLQIVVHRLLDAISQTGHGTDKE